MYAYTILMLYLSTSCIYTLPHLIQGRVYKDISNILCHLAMQNEHTVIRLEWQAIHTNYSYILDELAPDELVPYLEELKATLTRKSSRCDEEKHSTAESVYHTTGAE